jgi:glyoxylase-like metal-dependent hydrolase (beta-lactamase superfamily II)
MRIQVFPLTPFMSNCFLVTSDEEALIIDPGEAAPEVLRAVGNRTVNAIINTHGHCDHCAGNAWFKEQTGAPIYCHDADLPLLRALPDQGRMFGLPMPPSPDPDGFLNEGDTIRVGDETFSVLHVPGHSPGHIALFGNGVLIAGDVLFAGSIGRTDLPGGNHQELLASLRNKVMTLPGETVVYPGHGPETTVAEEKRTNPFLTELYEC